MTTYSITINERTSSGRELIQHLSEMPDIVFKKVDVSTIKLKTHKKASNRKRVVLEEIRHSIREAKDMEKNNSRTYTAEELLELL